jgi:hypothetical protein
VRLDIAAAVNQPLTDDQPMIDAVFCTLTVAFFALAIGYARLCQTT